MPKTKPSKPDTDVNLRHGGRATDTCPRCHYVRNKKESEKGKLLHGIPELTDSAKLRGVVGQIKDNLMRDKSLVGDPAAVFMMGVLEAKINGGEYYFYASSGRTAEPWIKPKHLDGITYHQGKWTLANPTLPMNNKGWLTVRGEKVNLDEDIQGVTRPCSAVKLLVALGEKHLDWNSVDYVRMSEMVYVGPKAEDARYMRAWHGQGATNSWTAGSCDACQARIPYLICDVSRGWLVNP
ncbi:hypothetical protein AF335_20940 [Streptomyces eurocidicus]|uniref:Uncharacterized protein n=1 Tax=Streptomyces eurocidicus TaxID=66423 RepID=A0A2N8NTT7_STREU|nr:hypothetical protein [Streptomyces eurocidicus]MBB5119351.1 hypothetical protein [Streptomyces eurocidicus]MBF6053069.1 hypothetical protein [Streptomyces eurocidicus]PNE32188.1 hypothetical protein AF335_20940 [Streptomyces eurocidicus]